MSVSALPQKKNEQNIAFLTTLVLLLNQNNTKNIHFVHIFITLVDSLSNYPFLTAYKMFEMLAYKHGLGSETLSPFIDSSIDNVLLQTNPDFTSRFFNSSIFLILNLFNKHAAAQQSNLVIDWLLVATYPKRWNFIKFFADFNAYFVCSVFPGNAEADVGWGGKLNNHLTVSCVRNMCTKNY